MKHARLYLLSLFSGLIVAVVFTLFEDSLSALQNYIWLDVFNTAQNRLLVVPLVLLLSLVYFGVLHVLDGKHENTIQHGLGNAPTATVSNLGKILLIGFFSLLSGASLGPEAVLVPASLVIGGVIAKQLKSDRHILGGAAFVALFVAFFNSLFGALLGVFLLKKQQRKFDFHAVISMLMASISAYGALQLLGVNSYFSISTNNVTFSLRGIAVAALLVIVGYLLVYALRTFISLVGLVKNKFTPQPWYKHAVVAALGLSILFLIGGEFVQFTGNEFIQPLLATAGDYSIIGLLTLAVIKLFAMAWSHQLGYRGGLVFPFVLVLSIAIIIVQRYVYDVAYVYALIATLVGSVIANKKIHTLF